MANVLSVVFSILSVVAVVLFSVALVYLLTVLFDKYSQLCQGDQSLVLTPEELTERQGASQLIKRAGLAGILPNERVQIFRYFLEQRAVPYTVAMSEDDSRNATEMTDRSHDHASTPRTHNEDDTVEAQPEQGISLHESPTTSAADEPFEGRNEQDMEDLCQTDHVEATCPICLSEYGAWKE
jgi:hypothetical protein